MAIFVQNMARFKRKYYFTVLDWFWWVGETSWRTTHGRLDGDWMLVLLYMFYVAFPGGVGLPAMAGLDGPASLAIAVFALGSGLPVWLLVIPKVYHNGRRRAVLKHFEGRRFDMWVQVGAVLVAVLPMVVILLLLLQPTEPAPPAPRPHDLDALRDMLKR